MTSRPKRVNVTLHEESVELLYQLQASTGMTPAAIVAKLFPSHLPDLYEYHEWLKQLTEAQSPLQTRGKHLLDNFGPGTLVEAIKKIDPNYETLGERFEKGLSKP